MTANDIQVCSILRESIVLQGSIEEWLRLLRLDEYVQQLLAQGYRTVRDVTQLPWEDMEDIGIVKLGHQKKLLLAIKRIKDILSGKWIAPGIANSPQVSHIAIVAKCCIHFDQRNCFARPGLFGTSSINDELGSSATDPAIL